MACHVRTAEKNPQGNLEKRGYLALSSFNTDEEKLPCVDCSLVIRTVILFGFVGYKEARLLSFQFL